jgi:phosphoserine phosphatase
VRRHRDAGEQPVIVTATKQFITVPLRRVGVRRTDRGRTRARSNVDHRRDLGVPSLREGKVKRVEQWLAARGLGGATAITFYSDSMNDLPLLEWATHPVATNPGPGLAAIARERGWPVLNLFTEEEQT